MLWFVYYLAMPAALPTKDVWISVVREREREKDREREREREKERERKKERKTDRESGREREREREIETGPEGLSPFKSLHLKAKFFSTRPKAVCK